MNLGMDLLFVCHITMFSTNEKFYVVGKIPTCFHMSVVSVSVDNFYMKWNLTFPSKILPTLNPPRTTNQASVKFINQSSIMISTRLPH